MLQILLVIGAFFAVILFVILVLKFAIDNSTSFALSHGRLDHLDFKVKKISIAKLDRYYALLLGIGFVLTLVLVNVIIEWKSYDEKQIITLGKVEDDFEEVYDIPQTTQPPPPKPQLQQPEIVSVPDEEIIEQEIEINLDVEITNETKIEEVTKHFPEVEEPEEEDVEQIFLVVQDQPQPVGGIGSFYEYLSEHIRYPDEARRIGISGRVFVEFVVDKDGSLTNAKVVKGIGGGCDEEALRVVLSAPKWNPGKQRGRPVKVRMTVPVFFKLE
ncbi:MAG: energy transducer TonB [Cytophagales bacterium]